MLVTKAVQRYWRLQRGLTLGAQGLVIGADGGILLVKHTYRPGWHFPGGGVERHEIAQVAVARELEEEAGVIVSEAPELFGLYANFRAFPSDHIALYVVRDWVQPSMPKPNREIAAHGFFTKDALPTDINAATQRRILEVLDGAPRELLW